MIFHISSNAMFTTIEWGGFFILKEISSNFHQIGTITMMQMIIVKSQTIEQ